MLLSSLFPEVKVGIILKYEDFYYLLSGICKYVKVSEKEKRDVLVSF
jgi:hypothetical protein